MFSFNEESDYGQDVLILAAEISSLMDEDQLYSKTGVNAVLLRIKNKAADIQKAMQGRDKADYFKGAE